MTERRPFDPDADVRDLLNDAVADVEPSYGLDEIRARTRPQRRRNPWLWGAVGAVAATAATVTAVTVLAQNPTDDGRTGVPAGTGSPQPTVTSEPVNPSPTDPATPSGGPALPVYYVGDTPTGPRLYREFAVANVADEESARLLAALEDAVAGSAQDPDYGSGWPAGFEAVGAGRSSLGGDDRPALSVALAGPGDLAARPSGMSEEQATMALQQLVYTAQAVVQQRLPVVFTAADGTPLDRLLGVDVSGGVTALDPMQVQATVWVITPQDGETVGPTFTVEGRGAFFEANVSWQLLDGDREVRSGFTTATECCTLAPYSFTVRNVPAGDYTLRVYDADMSGGESGRAEQQDTKAITVTK